MVSIDLGSTYTKGGLFTIEKGGFKLQRKESVPTTAQRLAEGFQKVLKGLTRDLNAPFDIVYSSSAKGGLSVSAVGIVPDLTSKMAYQAAVSAGARIHGLYSYKLNQKDISDIEVKSPDIILLTGGIDGGNEKYLRHNAQLLARMASPIPIVFAGNRAMTEEIRTILESRELYLTENVLPEMERPNPEPARQMIQRLFLERIVKGKGLSEIIDQTQV